MMWLSPKALRLYDRLLDAASLKLFSKVIEIGRSMAKPQGNLRCRELATALATLPKSLS
jgi:hypothetical protein